MKEQWKSEKDAATVEEGLQQEKQKYISKLKYNTNCCKQWIRYIRLIFLLELTLFFGWGCYMILQSYNSQVTENEATDMISERYSLVFESVSEVQKSTTEMPVIFVKPEDKLNNFLEQFSSIELEEPDLMPSKTIVIDVDSRMQTSTQNSISMPSNNMMEASDINNSPMTSPEDLVYDKEFMKTISWKISPIGNIDKISTTNENKESINYKFFEKLQNIVTSIAINELVKFENRNDFIENANRLMLNNQKDRALDTSNEIESLGLDVTTSLNLKDSVDLKISVRNSVQDLEQRLFDLIEDGVQDDHSEKRSSRDETDEQVNASLESDLVICPPYQSYESSGMSLEHSSKSFSASQSVLTPEFLKQIKNVPGDADIKNKGKHDADDSNMSMSPLSDVSTDSEEHFDTWIPIVQKDHHSSEIIAKQEEEKNKLIKNIEPSFNFGFLQSEIPDIVESSTSNVVKFQWFNAPPIFANDLQTESNDISESKKTSNPSDSSEDIIENMEIISSFIPGKDKSHNQCQMEIKMNVFRVKCPEIMFDKEWNLACFNTHTADILNVINVKDNFDLYTDDYNDYYDKDKSEQLKDELISNENSDKKFSSLQHSVSKVNDAVELQRIIPDERTSKNAFNFFLKKNSFDRTEVDKHDAVNSADKRKEKQEISSSSTAISSFTESDSQSDIIDSNKKWNPFRRFPTQQQKQSKVTETQDSENAETSLESNESIYALEKKLTSIFNDDMLNIVKQQNLSKSFSENNYSDYITQILWHQQYDDFKKLLENMHNHNNPYDIEDDYNYRKKRMADNLTEQPEQISNTLEEVNEKNMKLLKNLKKIFQEVEILAACIDRLHERLLNNKLDDDYVSNEFSKLKYVENHT